MKRLSTHAPLELGLLWRLSGKESACSARDEKDLGSIPWSGRSPGVGHGNPLQYYCLENSMDRGAWWATVYRFVKSQTQVKQLSTQASFMLHVVGRRSKTLNPQWISSITSLQSCPTLCNLMDCSPPGSSVHGGFQARTLEWVAMPFSRGSSWPRD